MPKKKSAKSTLSQEKLEKSLKQYAKRQPKSEKPPKELEGWREEITSGSREGGEEPIVLD